MSNVFDVLPATPADSSAVRAFLQTYYIRDSPLNKCLRVDPCPELEDWGCSLLTDDCSFKAVDATGSIVGVLLNSTISKTKAYLPPVPANGSPNYRTLMTFFHHLESRFDLFAAHPDCAHALEVGIMSVSTEWRGAGVAQALLDRTMRRVDELAIPLCYCICSSRFSGRACARAGFEAVFELPYAEYVVDGRRPVRPESPHSAAVLYAKRINNVET